MDHHDSWTTWRATKERSWDGDIKAYGHTGKTQDKLAITSAEGGDASITVAWTTPTAKIQQTVTSYDVRYIRSDAADKAASQWTVISQAWTSGDLQYVISGLSNGAGYDVQVRAVTADGVGDWSDSVKANPRTTPGAASIESLTSEDGTLTILWSAPSENGGSEITGYDLRYIRSDAADKTDQQWTEHQALWTSGQLAFTLSGLENDAKYDVQVRATNLAGAGEWSSTVTGTPTNPSAVKVTVELVPSNSVPVGTALSVTMKFGNLETDADTSNISYIFRADVKDAQGNDADSCENAARGYGLGVDRYMHQVDEDPEVRSGTTQATCPAGAYTVTATVSSPDNNELASATADFTIGAANKPGTPGLANPPAPGPASLTVTWTAPADSGDSAISSYDVHHIRSDASDKTDGSWTMEYAAWTSGTLQHIVNNLSNGVQYDVQVRAVNDAGAGPWSTTTTGTPRNVPGAPTITAGTSSDGALLVSWAPPADDGGGAITTYDARHIASDAADKSDGNWNVQEGVWTPGDAMEHRFSGLVNGIQYVVQIRAVNPAGAGPWSPAAAGTPQTTPGKPSISAVVPGDRTLAVSWTAPADDGGATITQYDLNYLRTGASQGSTAQTDSNNPPESPNHVEHILNQLTNGAEYNLRVRAVNAAGAGHWSDPVAATPQAPAPGPKVTIDLSPSTTVAEGAEITATMSFSNLDQDDERSTKDYIFRADVVGADQCENQENGYGLGLDRFIWQVDENPEVRTGKTATDCPAGNYTIKATLSNADAVQLASVTASFTVTEPEQQHQAQEQPPSTDATLSGLTLSDVTLAFSSTTTDYTASVANDVDETAVTPTVNDDGATYAIKLDGVADADGVVPLAVGSNDITVEVTAEDGNTVKTYTVTVTRAEPPSTDATLSSLTLSNINFGAFDSATTGYTTSVANDVDETTVTPTVNDEGATYDIKLGGVADGDGTVPLAVGSNVITIEVTAEDGETTQIYTVTVTRAEAPAPEPTVAIELSSGSVEEGTEITVTMSFANLTPDNDANLVFRADVVGAAGCEGAGIGVVRNISKVDEDPEVRTGTISGDCAAGDYTLEVSLSDDDVELASARAAFAVVEPEPTDETKPTSPPDAPDTATGEVTGKGRVQLAWNDVEGAAYYQVRFFDDDDAEWVELPTDEIGIVIEGSGATVSNLPDYGTYYFSVRAGNAAGLSDWSDYLRVPNPEQ